MPKTRIPSPSRSLVTTTPRRNKPRRSRSVCSPALSNASGRLTSVIDQFKENNMESFTISPMKSRWSVLTDNTDIDEPRRKSWWKNLNENSQDFMEVLEDNKTDSNNSIGDISDIEVVSQENKNLSSLDLPESSDNESIHSIVLTQRKLFTQKEKKAQKKFDQLIDARDKLTKLHKSNTTFHDKTITAGTKDLFQGTKKSKTVFPALLDISANKTTLDKTVENVVAEPKGPVKNIFGNRPAKKRKNIFADFIVSDSEHEVSDIQVQAKQSLLKRKKNDKTEDQVDEGRRIQVSLNTQEMVRQKYNASRDVGDEVNDNQDSDQGRVDQDIDSQKSNFESKDDKENANKQSNDLNNKNTVGKKTMDHVDNTGLGFDNDDKTSEKSDTESNGSLKLTYDSEEHQEIDENSDANKAIATDAVSEQDEQEKMKVDNCDNIKSTEKISSNGLELANNSKLLKKLDEMVYTDKAIGANVMPEQDDREKMAVDNYEIEKITSFNKQKSILIVADKTVENEKDNDENKVDTEHEGCETIDTDQHEQTIVNNDQVKENVANTENEESAVDKDQNEDNEVDNNRFEENEIDENEGNEVEDDKSQENEVDNNEIVGDAKLEENQLDDDENLEEIDNDEMEVDDENEENEEDSDKNEEEVDENEIEVDAELDESQLDNNEKEENEVVSYKNEEEADDNEIEVDDEKEENEVDSDKNEEEVDDNEIEVDAELDESQLDNDEKEENEVDSDKNEDEVDDNEMEVDAELDESQLDNDEKEENEVDSDKNEEEVDDNEIEVDAELDESQLDNDEKEENEVDSDKNEEEVDDNEMEVDAELDESQLDNDEKEENEVDSDKNEEEVDDNEIEVDAELDESQLDNDEKEENEVDSDKNEEEVDDNEMEVDAELDESQLDNDEKEENEVDSDKNEEEVDDNEIEVDAELDESQLDNNEKEENEVDSDENKEVDDDKLEESQSDNDENEGNEVDSDENEEHEVESDKNEENGLDNDESVVSEVENEDNEIEKDENEEGVEHEESGVDYDEDEVDNGENDIDDEHEQSEVENDQMEENEVDSDDNEDTEVGDDDNEVEDENNEDNDENQEHPSRVISSDEVIEESPNVTHDTTGRNRKKVKSPEVALHDGTKQQTSFIAKGRNTSIRETKTMYKDLNIRPSMAPPRDSLGLSEGNSSAEGSGWDSHRTTRKTLRQTFGKDFTPRKSLRALVMEKSAKRTTNVPQSESVLLPQANSTEYPQDSHSEVDVSMESDHVTMESDHEVSRRTRQTTLETYLQKMKQQNLEKKLKMEQAIRESLKAPPTRDTLSLFKVPSKPPPRRPKPTSNKPKKQLKSALFDELPSEVIEDMKYKPPKRFQPSNASWITKRLYKFLETKLEPKYDYKTRVRAEKLVETIYHFAKDLRRHSVAPVDAVDVLKHELARLEVVKTHFEFYEFFHEFMPREVRVKVVPDIVNKIPLPRHGVFADILRGNTVQG